MADRSTPPSLAFRPLATADLPTLHRWLSNPRVYRWYGGVPPASFAGVAAKYAPRTLAASAIRPYLILHEGVPIGYIQSYMVADDADYAALVGDDARGAAALDVLIGEDDRAMHGLGAALLRAFLGEVILADPGVARCFVDPHPENLIAIRAYARAGFQPWRRIDPAPPAEPCLLLRIERADIERLER
jgi:aminoglycoside 6'-N-acetyltransferase